MNLPKSKRVYVVDTNVLIQLSVWMPIDLNSIFWKKFEESLANGDWVLLDVMVEEIKYGNDGLKKWCGEQKKKGLIQSIADDHRNRAAEINNAYKMIDESSGKSAGDTYLLAFTEAHKLVVFSREAPRRNSSDLYKIPDVCKILNIDIIYRPREFFEAIGFKN